MLVYKTKERKGFGKWHQLWFEYRQEGEMLNRYVCLRHQLAEGNSNACELREHLEKGWRIDDPNIPEHIQKRMQQAT